MRLASERTAAISNARTTKVELPANIVCQRCTSKLTVLLEMFVPIFQLLALAAAVQSTVAKPQDAVKDLQKQAVAALKKLEVNSTQECSVANAAVRKDW